MAERTFRELIGDPPIVRVARADPGPVVGADPCVVVDENDEIVAVIGWTGVEDAIVVDADASVEGWFADEDFATLVDEDRCGVVVMSGVTVLGLVPAEVLATVADRGLERGGVRGELVLDSRLAGLESRQPTTTVVCRCGQANVLYDALPPYGRCADTTDGPHDLDPVEEP